MDNLYNPLSQRCLWRGAEGLDNIQINKSNTFSEADNTDIEPQVIPLLIHVTIRFGVPFVARLTTGVVVRVSSHATKQALKRDVTSSAINRSMVQGKRYIDMKTDARVTLDGRTAVIIDRIDNTVVTTYKRSVPKPHWRESSWGY